MVMGINIRIKVMMMFLCFIILVVTPTVIFGQGENASNPNSPPSWLDEAREYWLFRLGFNLVCYATLFLPAYLFIRYVRATNYVDKAAPGCVTDLVKLFVHGNDPEKVSLEEPTKKTTPAEKTTFELGLNLAHCTCGILVAYITWGVLQERIMARKYGVTDANPEGENFKDSTFLVFVNRILAFATAFTMVTVIKRRSQPKHTAPLFKYSYASFSNIMSSWFQYESLKYISFPTQVLGKSCKVIAVMIMGKAMDSKKTYQAYETITAGIITLGVAMFTYFSKDSTTGNSTTTTISGLIILAGYLSFDAFTSNWQGALFKEHKMSSVQMMAGVNFFSVLLTSVALIEQGGFIDSVAFMTRHPEFVNHIMVLSLCSAFGQLYIFKTISDFGPVVFTIIMTSRQALAIIISCIIYSHPVSVPSILGIVIVFSAIGIRMYCGNQARKAAKAAAAAASASTQQI